jgi:hypothetical protein
LSDGGQIDDVVRFNPAGTGGNPNYLSSVLIYSSGAHGIDSVADVSQPPFADYSNTLTISETTVGGADRAQYTPISGQPGFVSGFDVTYAITSDVPEPSSILLMLSGGVVFYAGRLPLVKLQSRHEVHRSGHRLPDGSKYITSGPSRSGGSRSLASCRFE